MRAVNVRPLRRRLTAGAVEEFTGKADGGALDHAADIWRVCQYVNVVRARALRNDQLDQERAGPRIGVGEDVGEGFDRLRPRRLDAETVGDADPVQVGIAEVEEGARGRAGRRADRGELAVEDGVAAVGQDDGGDVEALAGLRPQRLDV